MSRIQGYELPNYGDMINSRPRTVAYAQALHQSLQPGDIVLDIGSGPGLFAMLACQMGAGRVYALEPDDSILVAADIAKANGFTEYIQFIQNISTAVSLPERVNLIISDLRGVLPLFESHIPSIIDARKRFLAEGGTLIPQQDILYVTVVEDLKTYQGFCSPWQDDHYQLDLQAPLKYVLNGWQKANITTEQLLSTPKCWASLDYRFITQANTRGEVSLEIQRDGQAHGLSIWFDSELIEGVGFSNAPGAPRLIYGQAFFPFLKPLDVHEGDILHVNIRADLVGRDYEWTWKTRHIPKHGVEKKEWDFEQSTFFSMPLSTSRTRKISAEYKPDLLKDGVIARFMLNMMDGSHSLKEVATLAVERFPELIPDWKSAMAYASELAEKYGM
jgi:type I protein arginine methyltransferase